MHVRFKEAWHGKVQQTILQVKWRSICNELHTDKTPHQLFSLISFKLPNNIKCCYKHGKRWNIIKLTI